MQFLIESRGGVASRVKVGDHLVIYDQPTVHGGADTGPSPLDVLVASVGACAHYYAAVYLRTRKLPVDGLAVEVDASKSQARPVRVEAIQLRVRLPEGIEPRHHAPILAAVRTCPAYATLAPAVRIAQEIVRTSQVATLDDSA